MNVPMQASEDWVTLKEACLITGHAHQSIYYHFKQGRIRHTDTPYGRLYHRDDIETLRRARQAKKKKGAGPKTDPTHVADAQNDEGSPEG